MLRARPIAIAVLMATMVTSAAAGRRRRGARKPATKAKPTAVTSRDTRTTLAAVVVRKKPGEKQAAVGELPAGTIVIVEAEQGRWLRVRAGKLRGYLARTTVNAPAGGAVTASAPVTTPAATASAATTPAIAPPASADGKTTGWAAARRPDPAQPMIGELIADVTVPAATLRDDASASGAAIKELARGDRVYIIDGTSTPGWVRVRDTEGTAGWLAPAQLGNDTASAAISAREAPATATVRTTAAPVERERRAAIRIDAGLGFRVLGMDFTSNGARGLTNYLVTASAGAAGIELEATLRPSRRFRIAVDGRIGVSRSSPGIEYLGPTSTAGKIEFSTFAVDAGLRAGIRARRMFELAVRVGAHYDAFVATDVENAGMLPRERLLGGTLGVWVDIAPPRSRVSATLGGDALVLGDRRQTPGLEDGTESTAHASWGHVIVRLRIARSFALHCTYQLARATTSWSGTSMRDASVTSARRVDSAQVVQLGLSKEL